MENTLSKETFARLQKHAVPLIDTIETVVNRMIDFYEREGIQVNGKKLANSKDHSRFSPSTVPDLRHTKVISARLDGEEMDVNWNSLLLSAIRKSGLTAKQPEELKRAIVVNFVIGQKEDEGYRYMPRLGISVQGQDANSAAKAAFHIAQRFRWPLEVEFLWREKDGAARPGQMAILSNEALALR